MDTIRHTQTHENKPQERTTQTRREDRQEEGENAKKKKEHAIERRKEGVEWSAEAEDRVKFQQPEQSRAEMYRQTNTQTHERKYPQKRKGERDKKEGRA